MIPSRRHFLCGLSASLLVAPAIVRASSLMSLRGAPLIDFDPIAMFKAMHAVRYADLDLLETVQHS